MCWHGTHVLCLLHDGINIDITDVYLVFIVLAGLISLGVIYSLIHDHLSTRLFVRGIVYRENSQSTCILHSEPFTSPTCLFIVLITLLLISTNPGGHAPRIQTDSLHGLFLAKSGRHFRKAAPRLEWGWSSMMSSIDLRIPGLIVSLFW